MYVLTSVFVLFIKLNVPQNRLAPSKLSKHPSRNPRPSSPTQSRTAEIPQSTSLTSLGSHPPSGPSGWKNGPTSGSKPGLNLVEKIQPLSFVLQPPEEQTDNWDDDFEDGISFTKLQGRSPRLLFNTGVVGITFSIPSSGENDGRR